VLPLGMWSECFAHTRGGAGAVLGGRRAAGRRGPALLVPAPPRPAGRRCQPPAASVGGRRGGGGRRDARRTPRPARPGAPGDGLRRGTPAPPLPAGRGGAPLPKGPQQPFTAAGGQGREGGGRTAGAGAGGMRYCWLAARPGIRPAAGRGPSLACSLSIAIESVQPGFRSDSLHNMQDMLRICRIYNEKCGICNKICTIIR
jgi:hypothetical protein